MTDHATEQSIDTLLTKLGTDDNFRRSFSVDPGSALSAIGLSVSMLAGGAAANLALAGNEKQDLASKESFLAARDMLRVSLSGAPFMPITLAIQPAGPLASKETFLAARDELRASQSGAPFTPITLDLHPVASRAA